MRALFREERGSALVESAIVLPVLLLLIMFGAAMTDVMVLKLKAAEAVRYAVWETTVFKPAAQIQQEVAEKFKDLKSPRDLDTQTTDLLLYPAATSLHFDAQVDTTSTKVGIGGDRAQLPSGFWSSALQGASGGLAKSVDVVLQAQGFNTHGAATATVSLSAKSPDKPILLAGGDFVGSRGGSSLSLPDALANLAFRAPLPGERPMSIVFDTWKAWPKPAEFTRTEARTDVTVSPMRTYPEVEYAVSAQVKKIAFGGLTGTTWFNRLSGITGKILGSGVTEAVLGGHLPQIFSADRMDGPTAGPITILPVGVPSESWAPSECEMDGKMQKCGTQRLGSLVSSADAPQFQAEDDAMGKKVDRTRYTVPFKINSAYWTSAGGVSDGMSEDASLQELPASIATGNESVKSWMCRGHFFAGSQGPQVSDVSKRYGSDCQ